MALTSSAGLFREEPRGPDRRNHAKNDLEFLERSALYSWHGEDKNTDVKEKVFTVTSQLSCSHQTHARTLRFLAAGLIK